MNLTKALMWRSSHQDDCDQSHDRTPIGREGRVHRLVAHPTAEQTVNLLLLKRLRNPVWVHSHVTGQLDLDLETSSFRSLIELGTLNMSFKQHQFTVSTILVLAPV